MAKFNLTVLGAGVMVPTKERNPAGFLVEIGNKKVLLDMGHGIIRRMVDFGIDLTKINDVFISHFHTDHFNDAFSFVHTRRTDDMYKNKPNQKLTFLCPKGTRERYDAWRKIFWPEPDEDYPIEFLEGERKLKLGKIEIEIFSVKHVKYFASVGIVIKYEGKKLVYTGDIGSEHSMNDLIKIVTGADLLITEAASKKPRPNHYTLGQVQEVIAKGNVKKALVIHIPPYRLTDLEEAAKKDEKLIISRDGMKIEIGE